MARIRSKINEKGLVAPWSMLVDFIQIPNETLHKLDMEEKKKDGNAKKSSKFLVPFSPNTPRPARDTTSSVFLTPPYSAECQGGSVEKAIKIPCFPRDSVKIPFELSFEVEELDRDYKFDILRALRDSDLIQTVVKKILEHLDDLSLFRWGNWSDFFVLCKAPTARITCLWLKLKFRCIYLYTYLIRVAFIKLLK